MDLENVLPVKQVAEILNISDLYVWLIFFIIFLIGYVALKYFIKVHSLKDKFDSIDKLFLIAIFGSVFLLEIFYVILWVLGIRAVFINPPDENTIMGGLLSCFMLFFTIWWWIRRDILLIINQKYELMKRKKHADILLSIFFSLLFLGSTIMLWNESTDGVHFFMILMVISSFVTISPFLYWVIRWYKQMSV
jgi:hypothetical protein